MNKSKDEWIIIQKKIFYCLTSKDKVFVQLSLAKKIQIINMIDDDLKNVKPVGANLTSI